MRSSELYSYALQRAIATGWDGETATALAEAVVLMPRVASLLVLKEGVPAVERLVRAITKNQRGGGSEDEEDLVAEAQEDDSDEEELEDEGNEQLPRDWLSDTLSSRKGVFIVMFAAFLFLEFARRQLFQADGIEMVAMAPMFRGPSTETAEQLSRAMQLDPASSSRAQEIMEQFGSSMSSGPFGGLLEPVATEESLNSLRVSVREAIAAVPAQHGNLSVIAEWMGNFMTEHISNILVALTGGALTAFAVDQVATKTGPRARAMVVEKKSDKKPKPPPRSSRKKGGGKSRRQKALRPRRAKTKARKAMKSKRTRRI